MLAYHFYVNGVLPDWETEGQNFVDDTMARAEATRAFGEILQFDPGFLTKGQLSLTVLQRDRVVLALVATASTEAMGPPSSEASTNATKSLP